MSVHGRIFYIAVKYGDRKRDAGYTPPKDMLIHENIRYGDDPVWNTLDVYAAGTGIYPIIVNIHGGGYVAGSRHNYRVYCMELARRGFMVINFSYSLAPRARYPRQLEEINRVLRWAARHAKDYGGDIEKLFVAGDSAGAQMACQYLAVLTNPEYAAYFSFSPPDISVKGCLLNCGMYDISPDSPAVRLAREKDVPLEPLLRDYLGRRPRKYPQILNVPEYVTGSFPPAFIMTAVSDFLKGAEEPLARRLMALGVKTVHKCYGKAGDKQHGHVFHLNWSFEGAAVCNDEECAFLLSCI